MKKIIVLVLVGLMAFTSIGFAFAAEEPKGNLNEEKINLKEETKLKRDQLKEDMKLKREQFREMRNTEKGNRLEIIKEFVDERHQINELRIERHELRIQEIEKNDLILDLFIEAREDEDTEALEAAREIREQIREINIEIRELHEQAREARAAFREVIENEDIDTAREYLNEVILLIQSINIKHSEKIDLLDQIIEVL